MSHLIHLITSFKLTFFKSDKTYIIAEIGNNHEGSFDQALRLIESAANAGADAVKFQSIIPEDLVRISDQKRIDQLRRFELSADSYFKLKQFADTHNVDFMSTPFSLSTVEFLDPLVNCFKVSSGDLNFYQLRVYFP